MENKIKKGEQFSLFILVMMLVIESMFLIRFFSQEVINWDWYAVGGILMIVGTLGLILKNIINGTKNEIIEQNNL